MTAFIEALPFKRKRGRPRKYPLPDSNDIGRALAVVPPVEREALQKALSLLEPGSEPVLAEDAVAALALLGLDVDPVGLTVAAALCGYETAIADGVMQVFVCARCWTALPGRSRCLPRALAPAAVFGPLIAPLPPPRKKKPAFLRA